MRVASIATAIPRLKSAKCCPRRSHLSWRSGRRWFATAGSSEGRVGSNSFLRELHIGPMLPAEEAARRAIWVASLINPIPALGVAYEIRPALLMARDTRGMLKVATDGITLSIENLQSQIRGGRA